MEAKDIHKEMLPIWAAFPVCGYLVLKIFTRLGTNSHKIKTLILAT
jgi:hypothetical protein